LKHQFGFKCLEILKDSFPSLSFWILLLGGGGEGGDLHTFLHVLYYISCMHEDFDYGLFIKVLMLLYVFNQCCASFDLARLLLRWVLRVVIADHSLQDLVLMKAALIFIPGFSFCCLKLLSLIFISVTQCLLWETLCSLECFPNYWKFMSPDSEVNKWGWLGILGAVNTSVENHCLHGWQCDPGMSLPQRLSGFRDFFRLLYLCANMFTHNLDYVGRKI